MSCFFILTRTTLFKDDAPHKAKPSAQKLLKSHMPAVIKRRLTETSRLFTLVETHLNKIPQLLYSHLARWTFDLCFCYWIWSVSKYVCILGDDLMMCPVSMTDQKEGLPLLLTDTFWLKDYHFEHLYNIWSSPFISTRVKKFVCFDRCQSSSGRKIENFC